MRQPFLGADQSQDLGLRIDVDAVSLLAEDSDRLPQLGSTLVEGVLMECRVLGVVLETADDLIRRRADLGRRRRG